MYYLHTQAEEVEASDADFSKIRRDDTLEAPVVFDITTTTREEYDALMATMNAPIEEGTPNFSDEMAV